MSQVSKDDVLWVRFPKGEVEISIMSHNGQHGILILPDLDNGGRAVMDKAVAMGFQERRRSSGGSAAVFLRDPVKGFPFNVRKLAESLGGVAMRIPRSVFEAEKYPRRPVSDSQAAPAPSSNGEVTIKQTKNARILKLREEALAELSVKAAGIADDGAGDEIADILREVVWGPDEVIIEVSQEEPETESPGMF